MDSSSDFAFKRRFPRPHTVIPVVRIDDATEAILEVIGMLHDAGAHGVMLVNRNRSISHRRILEIHEAARMQHPRWWIGMNMLDIHSITAAMRMPQHASGIWLSDIGINPVNPIDKAAMAHHIKESLRKSKGKSLCFGGLPKRCGHGHNQFLALTAKHARNYSDILAIGNELESPDLGTVIEVRKAIGDFPLAIAGIMQPRLIDKLLPYVDCLLPYAPHNEGHSHSPAQINSLMQTVLCIDPHEQPPSMGRWRARLTAKMCA